MLRHLLGPSRPSSSTCVSAASLGWLLPLPPFLHTLPHPPHPAALHQKRLCQVINMVSNDVRRFDDLALFSAYYLSGPGEGVHQRMHTMACMACPHAHVAPMRAASKGTACRDPGVSCSRNVCCCSRTHHRVCAGGPPLGVLALPGGHFCDVGAHPGTGEGACLLLVVAAAAAAATAAAQAGPGPVSGHAYAPLT